jgi:hypothetical protein
LERRQLLRACARAGWHPGRQRARVLPQRERADGMPGRVCNQKKALLTGSLKLQTLTNDA